MLLKLRIARGYSFTSGNLLLAFCIAAVFIITADLCSEMAAEKNEIGFFLGILEEGETKVVLPIDYLSTIDRPLLFEIPLTESNPSENICKIPVKDRSPPQS